MTENEAIDKLNNLHYKILHSSFSSMVYVSEIEALCMAKDVLQEIQQYRAIGTVEEFKALKEKNVAKKPRFYAHNYYCTECGNLVGNNEFEWQRFLYCDKCGKKLDWQ